MFNTHLELLVTRRGVVAVGSVDQAAFQSLLWFGGLVLVLLLSALVIGRIRKRFGNLQKPPGIGLTLDDLRRQHDLGRLTDTEYESLKAAVITAIQADEPGGSLARRCNLFQGVGRS